jgi:ABC-type branched-subunit amino acid transport system ATPase component
MVLRLESVAAGYGSVPVISNVSVEVGRGEVVSLIGPNGAGKSTLLKAITGQLRIVEGRVVFEDADVTNTPTAELARKGIGYVPQVNDVFPDLTVRENLQMGGYLLKQAEVGERVSAVAAMFPALATLLPRAAVKLSGGERKLVAIGRALMLRPRLLLLDEPTASLSPKLSADLLENHVRRLADSGTAVLLVEQKASAALRVSDWGYVMVSGRPKVEGSARDLLDRHDFGDIYLGSGADQAKQV